jgi:hypothetical protein
VVLAGDVSVDGLSEVGMSVGAGVLLFAGVMVLVEVLNVFLGLWPDRVSEHFRHKEPRRPWSGRTRT